MTRIVLPPAGLGFLHPPFRQRYFFWPFPFRCLYVLSKYIPCYGPPFVHDLDRGRRESTLEDYTNFVKLSYASKSMDITGGMMAEPNDIPHERRNAEMVLASMRYSDKPFMGGANGAEAARETIEMAAILFGCFSEEALAEKMPMISICAPVPSPGLR